MEQLSNTAGLRQEPLVMTVSGLPGVGRSTLATALTRRFGVVVGTESDEHADPDLRVHVIGAQVRRRDRAILAAVRGPVIVAASRADTDPRAADHATTASACLGRRVLTVSGLLGGAVVEPADRDLLEWWRHSEYRGMHPAPSCTGHSGRDRDRAALTARLGRVGIDIALAILDDDPTADARRLTAGVRAHSGIDAFIGPITEAAAEMAAQRRRRRLSGLRLTAARGHDRAAVEQRLMIESVR